MTGITLWPPRVPGPWSRAAGILVAGGILALLGSRIGPESSRADMAPLGGAPRAVPTRASFADAVKLPAYMGTLTGARYTVDVYLGRAGPLYTVRDAAGNTLGSSLTSDEVYAKFPELNLDSIQASGDRRDAGEAP